MNNLARIVVFGAEYCGFCKKAYKLLSNANAKFSYLNAEDDGVM